MQSKHPVTRLHHTLRESHPHIVRKVKKPFSFKYPKLLFFAVMVVLAYFVFTNSFFVNIAQKLTGYGYLSAFIGGLLFSYGFTTPFAIGIFLNTSVQNIFLASIIGGFGALLADYTIFKLIKLSFMNEFLQIEKTPVVKAFINFMHKNVNSKINLYLIYIFAGFIIASPLPDEVGVAMLAGLGHIKPRVFAIISILMNSIGIFIMLSLA